jgi:hypothetical protein
VHKKTISYCVKDVSGRIQQEGKVGSTRRKLDCWMKTLPQPWSAGMEARSDRQSKAASDAEFAKEGLTRVDSNDAKLYIAYQAALQQEKQYTSYNSSPGATVRAVVDMEALAAKPFWSFEREKLPRTGVSPFFGGLPPPSAYRSKLP